ncbi:hypothetical protein AB656_04220 [Bifidobacterium actinocoloniiforme DSM 22766]|nr:peptide chain release factor N(5)-glutamine methyltransferase [Bifidobacterium actinocoloniiforme]AKV56126.1 hypothetical protein AB656_04220 [Bifidobacterium actinocoloniiforme DSM 22766]
MLSADERAGVQAILAEASGKLAGAGVDTPENDARLLLAEACRVDLHDLDKALLLGETVSDLAAAGVRGSAARAQGVGDAADADAATVIVHIDPDQAGKLALGVFRDFVIRRAGREPLQYIVGHAPFRFLDLAVGPGVFIPRPETETVVQAGLDWLAGEGIERPLVVDLCAGSGAIGLAVATEVPGAQVWAVEVSEEAAAWARRNADRYRQAIANNGSSYQLVLADATAAETLADLNGRVDLVISNPPYIPEREIPAQPEVTRYDPPQALYGASPDGTAIPGRIIARAADLLRPAGCLVMEHDPSQSAVLRGVASAAGFTQVRTDSDMTGKDRCLLTIKGAADTK